MNPSKKIQKITLIQPKGNFFNLLSKVVMPRYGITILGTILKDLGYDVQIFVEDISPINWERILDSDFIGFKTMSCTHNRTRELIQKIKSVKEIPVVMGGTHATFMKDECLEFSDFVIRQEGDESLPDLIRTLNENGDLSAVAGLSYKSGGRIIHNPDRPPVKDFERSPDISLIQGYPRKRDISFLREKRFRLLCLQTSRGCTYNCSFCPASAMFGPGYRTRSIDSIIGDIRNQMKFSSGRTFIIVDNNFAADKERTKQLLRRILKERINANFLVFVRLDIAEDEELLELFRRAGVGYLYLGMESLNDSTLKKYKKGQMRTDIEKSIRTIKKHELNLLGSFVMGADDDTKETIRDTVDFAINSDFTGLYMFCLTEFPVETNKRLLPLYRTFQYNLDYVNGNFVIHFPKGMKPSTLQREVTEGQLKFYSNWRIAKSLIAEDFWVAMNKLFYGYMWNKVGKEVENYMEYLRGIEKDYYDKNEELLEDKLISDYRDGRGVFASLKSGAK